MSKFWYLKEFFKKFSPAADFLQLKPQILRNISTRWIPFPGQENPSEKKMQFLRTLRLHSRWRSTKNYFENWKILVPKPSILNLIKIRNGYFIINKLLIGFIEFCLQ